MTQEQYEEVMGTNPSEIIWANGHPVDNVCWDEAVEFCSRLSAMEGNHYRLPTEAEWEYACRAGTATPFAFGDTISTDQVNYNGNFVYGRGREGQNRNRTTRVGALKPNAWGLYDMHGNVDEWCQDWYADDYYTRSPETDPPGPASGKKRVIRGGSRASSPRSCRSAKRYSEEPTGKGPCIGFRVVLSLRARD